MQVVFELKATIRNGTLKDVHRKAFAIRDLVAALPAHASALPADARAKLHDDVKFVATLAARLDASGDANDKAATQANYDKMVGVLNGIVTNAMRATSAKSMRGPDDQASSC